MPRPIIALAAVLFALGVGSHVVPVAGGGPTAPTSHSDGSAGR